MIERAPDETGPDALVRMLETAGVRDRRIIAAYRRIRREDFVPAEYAATAYVDAPVPIGQDQVTSQPSLIGQMVAVAAPASGDHVLEIGTGFGFQTAVLGTLARWVWSVERYPDLADAARRNLHRAGVDNATVVTGDGTRGLPEHAPYQAVVVSATAPEVPSPLADQLAEDGRLVQPIGGHDGEYVTLFGKRDGHLVERATVTPARFVPLCGRHADTPSGPGD